MNRMQMQEGNAMHAPSSSRRAEWERDGFFVVRGMLSESEVSSVLDEVIGRIRAEPPSAHKGERSYFAGPNYHIFPETAPSPTAVNAEDQISRVFNCHAEGLCRAIAERASIVTEVVSILGPDVDCFQSQFIFKNPGVIGQPWHQDSHYFQFDLQPQVGVWIALSRATEENGCLWVLPGSHREPIHEHVPDHRPEANAGYLEIVDHDFSAAVPVLMDPGDVLFFHSYLMHKSSDNITDYRRAALVLHYGRAGTKPISPTIAAGLADVNRWVPVARASRAAS